MAAKKEDPVKFDRPDGPEKWEILCLPRNYPMKDIYLPQYE